MDYRNTYSGRQHWTIYGCFDEATSAPVAIRFFGTEYQANRLSYMLACAFGSTPCWDGHTIAVNGHVYGRQWRGGKGKKKIPAFRERAAS